MGMNPTKLFKDTASGLRKLCTKDGWLQPWEPSIGIVFWIFFLLDVVGYLASLGMNINTLVDDASSNQWLFFGILLTAMVVPQVYINLFSFLLYRIDSPNRSVSWSDKAMHWLLLAQPLRMLRMGQLAYRTRQAQNQADQHQTGQNPAHQHQTDQNQADQHQTDQNQADQHQTGQNPAHQHQTGQNPAHQHQTDQNQTDQHQTDQNPADQHQTDQNPALMGQNQTDQNPAHQHQTDQNQAHQHQTDQNQTDQNPANQHQTDQNQAHQHQTDQNPAHQHQTDQNPANQHQTDQNPAHQHQTDQNQTDQNQTDPNQALMGQNQTDQNQADFQVFHRPQVDLSFLRLFVVCNGSALQLVVRISNMMVNWRIDEIAGRDVVFGVLTAMALANNTAAFGRHCRTHRYDKQELSLASIILQILYRICLMASRVMALTCLFMLGLVYIAIAGLCIGVVGIPYHMSCMPMKPNCRSREGILLYLQLHPFMGMVNVNASNPRMYSFYYIISFFVEVMVFMTYILHNKDMVIVSVFPCVFLVGVFCHGVEQKFFHPGGRWYMERASAE